MNEAAQRSITCPVGVLVYEAERVIRLMNILELIDTPRHNALLSRLLEIEDLAGRLIPHSPEGRLYQALLAHGDLETLEINVSADFAQLDCKYFRRISRLLMNIIRELRTVGLEAVLEYYMADAFDAEALVA